MTIIRNLNECGNVIEPSNSREWVEMYLCCMKIFERKDISIDYRLLEIGVLGVTRALVVLIVCVMVIMTSFSFMFSHTLRS